MPTRAQTLRKGIDGVSTTDGGERVDPEWDLSRGQIKCFWVVNREMAEMRDRSLESRKDRLATARA